MIHQYLMAVDLFFSGEQRFEIEASCKDEARKKADVYVMRRWWGNYVPSSVRILKKIRRKPNENL